MTPGIFLVVEGFAWSPLLVSPLLVVSREEKLRRAVTFPLTASIDDSWNKEEHGGLIFMRAKTTRLVTNVLAFDNIPNPRTNRKRESSRSDC